MGLRDDFLKIVAVTEAIEGTTVPPRIAQRLAKAYERAAEKALVLAWYEITEVERCNRTLLRHLERGATDYLP